MKQLILHCKIYFSLKMNQGPLLQGLNHINAKMYYLKKSIVLKMIRNNPGYFTFTSLHSCTL